MAFSQGDLVLSTKATHTHAVGSLLSPAVFFIFPGMVTLLQEQTAALVLAARVFGLLQSTFSGGFKAYSTRSDPILSAVSVSSTALLVLLEI